ncbi:MULTISPECIES: 4'-phosphopantetheinyl transferase superfamily protein [unclassified Streptomyces]|uniref:4'-phosphopantetheinyl transferase family protein n=1 Tax=unclassified Streptomyces TaxID=2593676 RepID=UPI000DC79358|nr:MULTISPECIES: 4'-phosphopantetheinyl transferase superfamily protein [unclassified Streptomyces]AWZ04213.1 4'-phosphopantetheinyl transferase [Streptomyces sp. ICC4]AWZ11789.1 4'-phosphopantetheinyl transferase [Streptomyces sp. ICC1]
MIDRILPRSVSAYETHADSQDGFLFPEERAIVARALPGRVREFTTGRYCARQALACFGVPPGPILRDDRGAPLWPDRIRGSITHCHSYRAAAVAESSSIGAIGIDAEPHAALPPGVLGTISVPHEAADIRALLRERPGIRWDRLPFSAKESAYKAWRYPPPGPEGGRVQKDLDFKDIVVSGRWLAGADLLLTAVVVPAVPA